MTGMRDALYSRLVFRVVFPLPELLEGRRMRAEVCRLRNLQWYSPEARVIQDKDTASRGARVRVQNADTTAK
jgi:hypothetical protein